MGQRLVPGRTAWTGGAGTELGARKSFPRVTCCLQGAESLGQMSAGDRREQKGPSLLSGSRPQGWAPLPLPRPCSLRLDPEALLIAC